MTLLADPTMNHAFPGQRETSHAAAKSIWPRTGTARWRVLIHFYRNGSYTDEEVQDALGMNPSTERPRRLELVQSGWVKKSGFTRPTRSGERAIVWQITPEARRRLNEQEFNS